MAGSGPFGWLTGALGERDVRDDIADYQAQQLARNRAGIGLDPNGNPLPPGGPAPAGGPPAGPAGPPLVPGAPGSANAPAPIQMQDPSQTPNATKTPQDLGTLMMRLGQQEERNQGFNQALGLGFAAFAQPRDREMVSKVFNTNLQDPNALGKTIMDANNQQAGTDQANAVRAMVNGTGGQAIADALHMDLGALRTMMVTDSGAAGKIAAALGIPTDAIKNIYDLQRMKGSGAGGSTINDLTKAVTSNVGGPENAPMLQAQEAWRNDPKNLGKPDSAMPWHAGDLSSYRQFVSNEAAKEDTRGKAADALPKAEDIAGSLYQKISNLKDSPAFQNFLKNGTQAQRALAKQILAHPDGSLSNLSKIAGVGFGADTPQIVAALSDLREITGKQYQEALHSIGVSRFSTQEVESVNKGMGQLGDISMPADAYNDQAIGQLLTSLKKVRANNYAATGNMNTMPTFLRPYVNKTYLPKGELYKEGSGADAWAEEAHKPLPAATLKWAKDQVKADPRLRPGLMDHLQSQGYDVEEGAF